MTFNRLRRTNPRGFNLTPMIDVVFQLVIFFLVTAQFGELTHTQVDLPRQPGEQEDSGAKPTFILDIDEYGDLFMQSEPITIDGLVAAVAREIERVGGPDTVSIRVRPDRLSQAADLNRVTRRVSDLGVSRWSIATVAPGQESRP